MSEILKNETESIVNLAEYLTNLNLKIDNLAAPIDQLQEETHVLCDLVQATESRYAKTLLDVKKNNLKQNHMNLKLDIINTSQYVATMMDTIELNWLKNPLTLERVTNKYTFQKICLEELNITTPETERILAVIESNIICKVNNCFLYALDTKDTDILSRCLRMYIEMEKQDDAHDIFRIHKLKPVLGEILCEAYLEKCDQDLDRVYLKVKEILDTTVDFLSELVHENSILNCFNFVLGSFWKEFDRQSRENLPYITAPGNPDLFQKRFKSTYNLLAYIAVKAGDERLIKNNKEFQDHLKRFNLAVYFEIKFQQISGKFESEIIDLTLDNISTATNNQDTQEFSLKPSAVLYQALQSCFDKDVYIDQLADQFIKLTMMLLSRYLRTMENLLKDVSSSTHLDKDEIDLFVFNVITDFSIVKSLVAPKCQKEAQMENTIFAIIESDMRMEMKKVFDINEEIISSSHNIFSDYFATSKITECISQLQNVTALPRLYRRTNRNPPKEASSYVVEAVKPITVLTDKFGSNLHQIAETMEIVIIEITGRYSSLVEEVLRSVCKTEESLRRLKNRTLNLSGDSLSSESNNTMSDETKIKEQIKFDVCYFCEKLVPLAPKTAKIKMDLLKNEVDKLIK
ncbi:conserved oligomeric Golgi complex subunit 2 isoform X2 [Euwallacea fornicatus]